MKKTEFKTNDILIGGAIAVFILFFVFSNISYTKITIGSVIGDFVHKEKKEPSGTRFYLFGEHIHHYVFGILGVIFSYFYLARTKFRKYAGYVFGFSLVLVLDQLPHILGLVKFGV